MSLCRRCDGGSPVCVGMEGEREGGREVICEGVREVICEGGGEGGKEGGREGDL